MHAEALNHVYIFNIKMLWRIESREKAEFNTEKKDRKNDNQ